MFMRTPDWYQIGDGSGGSIPTSKRRRGETLDGELFNGVLREFPLKEVVNHVIPTDPVLAWHGGRRLDFSEYEIYESVIGGGFDSIRFLCFAPKSSSRVIYDYTAA